MLTEIDTLTRRFCASGAELLRRQQDCNPQLASRAAQAGVDGPAATAFAGAREAFDAEVLWLSGAEAAALTHSELEDRLEVNARELYRLLLQDHLELRAQREAPLRDVVGVDGVRCVHRERGHERPLHTVFGEVRVRRNAYRARGCTRLFPADAALNLPAGVHSHGLARLAAIESSRGSFEDAQRAIVRATGQLVPKRQLERLAAHSACDFEAFYEDRQPPGVAEGRALVLSCDGKGVVMRPGALRPETRRAAQRASHKLSTRLSRGEKRDRKRLAEVGAVYEIKPVPRTPADILPASDPEQPASDGPVAQSKWLTASVVDDAASVVAQIFDEAERRDPDHEHDWVALVDGNNHQIARIKAEAHARHLDVSVIVDFIHVLEYLWKATWCFHPEGDPAAEEWVKHHAHTILSGKATTVAGAIRRQATKTGLQPAQRAGADICATYLTNKAAYLDYPTALTNGWPIATGVIEGACRHLVKDRMDITGARWGLQGAEAILKLRALHANGDLADYWRYHLTQEHQRNHQSRYANNTIPLPTTPN